MHPKNMCGETKPSAEQLLSPIAELVLELSQRSVRQIARLLRHPA